MLKILFVLFGVCTLFGDLFSLENEESKIQEQITRFTEAFNKGDFTVLSSLWTSDATFSKPETNEVVEGKDPIMQLLQWGSKELKERDLKFTFQILKIDFPNANRAVVQGVVNITDKGNLIQRNARQVEFLKQNGKWLINSVKEIEVPPPPPVYNHLKELEWLIGKWKDSDENVTITFNTEWDKFKNFLKQNFRMEVYDLEALEGIQIIGWDPIENKIRSWVFDSDGGFGTGLWSKKNDNWHVVLNYILSDGKKGSATNIYTKVDERSYRFSSNNREVEGAALPNIEPVTVSKEE